jgi:hypothetical protein
VIRIENGSLIELADSFLEITKGFDMPVGSVVVLSSLTYLARVGTAAYAEELVRSLARIRDAYASSVRIVHGFPVLIGGLDDESVIRSILEIELWLSDSDKRRMHSLPNTSAHYISEWLKTGTDGTSASASASDIHPRPLKLPNSLHSLEKATYVSPGWEDLATCLPALQEEDEKNLLGVIIEELNEKFALQLDLEPSTDRFSQPASDNTDSESVSMIFAGSSHSARTLDMIDREGVNLLDATTPGYRLSPETVGKMADDIRDLVAGLDPSNTVVSIQVLDNSTYYCGHTFGEMSLPKKYPDRKYHVEGELRYVKKQLFRELFALLLLLVKAAGECHVVIWAPIPRWLHYSCCGNPTHCTNRNSDDFAGNMNSALADIRQWLEDMATLRKLHNVHIFNPLPALGMTGPEMDIDHALELWGTDPVHPTEDGYAALAESVKQLSHDIVAGARAAASEEASKAAAPKPAPAARLKPVRREGWIAGSDEVARRNLHQQTSQGRGRPFPSRGFYPRGGRQLARPWGRGGGGAPTARGAARGGHPASRPGSGPGKRGFKGRGWRGNQRGR